MLSSLLVLLLPPAMGLARRVTATVGVVLALLILRAGPQGAPLITIRVLLHAPRLTTLLLILAVDIPSVLTPTTTVVRDFWCFAKRDGALVPHPFFSCF